MVIERQARIMRDAPRLRNCLAASKPMPPLPPVIMIVSPTRFVPDGTGEA